MFLVLKICGVAFLKRVDFTEILRGSEKRVPTEFVHWELYYDIVKSDIRKRSECSVLCFVYSVQSVQISISDRREDLNPCTRSSERVCTKSGCLSDPPGTFSER